MNAPVPPETRSWPAQGLTRVPYWIYQDEDIYRREQELIFRGATWTFLGLEAELPNPGDWKTTFVGDMPVVVARDAERCAACVREPLRASRRAALPEGPRQLEGDRLHLPQLDLRPRGKPHCRRVSPRDPRQGRDGRRRRTREPGAVQAPARDLPRPRVRDALGRDAADRGVPWGGDRSARAAGDEGAGQGPRRLQPDAAEQLEALSRQRQGHLPREPATPLLHHVPHQPSVAGRAA